MDVHERLEALRQLPRCEIEALPSSGPDTIVTAGGREWRETIWHERMTADEHKVVVTWYDQRVGMKMAGGFVLGKDDSIRALTDQELREYL